MYLWTQNLSDDLSKQKRPLAFYGRARLFLGKAWASASVAWEWQLGGWHFGASIEVGDDEDDVGVSVAVPGFRLWAHSQGLFSFLSRLPHREIRLSIHSGTVWWNWWTKPDEWSSRTPWYQSFSINLTDVLFGRAKYTKEVLSTESVLIPMPERQWPAEVMLERCTWKRPRGFAVQKRYATIKLDDAPSFPGKGENSWDIDDDAILQMSCESTHAADIIGKYVGEVLKNRQRRGGSMQWQPQTA